MVYEVRKRILQKHLVVAFVILKLKQSSAVGRCGSFPTVLFMHFFNQCQLWELRLIFLRLVSSKNFPDILLSCLHSFFSNVQHKHVLQDRTLFLCRSVVPNFSLLSPHFRWLRYRKIRKKSTLTL